MAWTTAVFSSAALLFVIEPMFGKMVLPRLGGSPAVWTTCMLFFQGALLLGYLYAHLGPRWFGVRRHALMHLGLLALCLLILPIRVNDIPGASQLRHPTLWLLGVLALSLGAPFVLLSSTAPLLQIWFSQSTHPQAENPYFLYAASNAGSLLALLSYPFLIEPSITLQTQSTWWSLTFVVLVGLVAISAPYGRRRVVLPSNRSDAETSRIPLRTMARWTVLAFVPSSYFLALTTYITTDVAAVPLVWVVPLVFYLLSFTIVFGPRVIIPHRVLLRWQPVGLIAIAVIDFWGPSGSSPWLLPLHLLVFFVTALVCHGELANTKPPGAQLTTFYLCLAVGGVLGGVFNAVVAPMCFDSVLEYPLTILMACAARPRLSDGSSHQLRRDLVLLAGVCALLVLTRLRVGEGPALVAALIASTVVAVICLRMSRDPIQFAMAVGGVVVAGLVIRESRPGILLKERNFFGVREVREDARSRTHVLMHGTTKHGAQSTDPGRRGDPLSYHSRQGPLGDIFRTHPAVPGRRVAVIGLGTGAMAAYSAAGEEWVFYEIDRDIARVARDPRYFTYLQDARGKVEIILGDGRLSLAEAIDHSYDLIVIDAFSSDAIPIHLLTREALEVYTRKLSRDGLLVLHLSNRYLDLEPVLGRLVQSAGMTGLIRHDSGGLREREEPSGNASVWAAVASTPSLLGELRDDPRWRSLRIRPDVALWSDDFSNIFSVFHRP